MLHLFAIVRAGNGIALTRGVFANGGKDFRFNARLVGFFMATNKGRLMICSQLFSARALGAAIIRTKMPFVFKFFLEI